MEQGNVRVDYRTRQMVQMARRRRKKRRLARRCILCGVVFFACIKLCSVLLQNQDGWAGLGDSISGRLNDTEVFAGAASGKYPDSLIELAQRNPETKQFVLDYPEKKDFSGKIKLSDEISKGEIPHFLQWDERWGYRKYGGDFMALNGCGPTCLSMVRCGLAGDGQWNPYKVAKMSEEEGYYVKGQGTSWNLMTSGAEAIGLTVYPVTFSEQGIRTALNEGHPIICVVGPGDFTTTGHFLVLTGVSANGEICIKDPNSREKSEKTWQAETLMSQIRNLWAYSYEAW